MIFDLPFDIMKNSRVPFNKMPNKMHSGQHEDENDCDTVATLTVQGYPLGIEVTWRVFCHIARGHEGHSREISQNADRLLRVCRCPFVTRVAGHRLPSLMQS